MFPFASLGLLPAILDDPAIQLSGFEPNRTFGQLPRGWFGHSWEVVTSPKWIWDDLDI